MRNGIKIYRGNAREERSTMMYMYMKRYTYDVEIKHNTSLYTRAGGWHGREEGIWMSLARNQEPSPPFHCLGFICDSGLVNFASETLVLSCVGEPCYGFVPGSAPGPGPVLFAVCCFDSCSSSCGCCSCCFFGSSRTSLSPIPRLRGERPSFSLSL